MLPAPRWLSAALVLCSVTAALIVFVFSPQVAQADPPVVAGFDRLIKQQPDAAGMVLLGELNCTACHQADEATAKIVNAKPSPQLTDANKRLRPEFLTQHLKNPHVGKPGTTMPQMLEGMTPEKQTEVAAALAHFLNGGEEVAMVTPANSDIAIGGALFHEAGCVACHAPQDGTEITDAVVIPFTKKLSSKYTLPSLTAFLQNPHSVRAGGRMPNLNLTEMEARQIASYLMRDLQVLGQGDVTYAYYEGGWGNLPDFDKLPVVAAGITREISVAPAKRANDIGLRFSGVLVVGSAGKFTFTTSSDDGSSIAVDGKKVVVNDGTHPTTTKSGDVELTEGIHEIVVDYFNAGGPGELKVSMKGPGIAGPIAEHLFPSKEAYEKAQKMQEEAAGVEKFVYDAEKAKQGQQFYASLGCASCHALKDSEGKEVVSTLKVPSLKEIAGKKGGCLADEQMPSVANYELSDVQKEALAKAITALAKPGEDLTPVGENLVTHTMATFNCYACHNRGDLGGVETARQEFFKGSVPEMGDEGRIPPPLNLVGAKLKPDFLKKVLENGINHRPYMLTRMPKFADPEVVSLASTFGKLDKVEPIELDIKFPEDQMKAAGHQLVGDKGLSCIKCHDFGPFKGTGVQAINMNLLHERLNYDWYHRYMQKPSDYRPGTRMPQSWPGGQTFFKDLVGGDADLQIRAVWTFLSDGPKARRPEGLLTSAQEIVPYGRPVMYRFFIADAGQRPFGFGYPENIHLAFDGAQMRLALVWRGQFFDATKHWGGRGGGHSPPPSDDLIKLSGGIPFAVLASAEESWPGGESTDREIAIEAGYKMGGFKLNEAGQPTFNYSVKEMKVKDFPRPSDSDEKLGLARTIELSGTIPENTYYRFGKFGKVATTDEANVFLINDKIRVKLTSNAGEATIRGGNELLLPLHPEKLPVVIEQSINW